MEYDNWFLASSLLVINGPLILLAFISLLFSIKYKIATVLFYISCILFVLVVVSGLRGSGEWYFTFS